MRLFITFIMLTSLPLQAMEQLENITVNLKNDKQISISPEQHKLLYRLSQTYADITQDTEKEVGTTQIITLNNIPKRSFRFIKKHLKQLRELGNPTPEHKDVKAFNKLKTDFNQQSDHRRKSIKQIVTYLDLPKTNFPPYLHGGQIHENHCRDVKSIINQYIFSDHSEWPLITNDLITKNVQTLKGHTDSVQCLTVSPDNRLISGSDDNTIKIWNLNTKKCIATLKGHNGRIRCLTLTTDNRLIAGSDDNTIKIWNLNTKKCIGTLKGHTRLVSCLIISPDNRLISGPYDGTIKIWDLNTHTCIATLKGHNDYVNCLTVSPDNRLISGSDDRTIKIWNLNTKKCIATLKGHNGRIRCLTLTTDNRLISGSHDKTIKIWDLNTHTCIATLKGHNDYVNYLALTSDNSRLISGSHDKIIKIWDLNTHTCIATLKGHNGWINCLALTFDNSRLIPGSADGTIKIWDLKKFREVDNALNSLSIADVAILKIIQDTIKQSEWRPNLCKKAKRIGASPALLELLGQRKTSIMQYCLIQ